MRELMIGAALLGLAGPAAAGTIVTYAGHITRTFDQQGHNFFPSTGRFIARFSYTEAGEMEWALLNIAGLPSWRFVCSDDIPDFGGRCEPLQLSETSISSKNAWSIEDVAEVFIQPRLPFNLQPWPDGKLVYYTKPEDDNFAFVGVSDLFGDCGFCYYMGTGVADRVTIGFGVPEPASWGLMLAGFGVLGASLRRRRALA